jgi:hypothetical protein
MFETDKSITKFRILQISGRENWKLILNLKQVIKFMWLYQ